MASFWSCQGKKVICPGQMTICHGQVSRRPPRPQPSSLSVADSRWLIDCEITLCQKAQTTKSTHSSSLVCFQLGTNYKVHCSGIFLISSRQTDDSSIAKSLYVKRYKLQSPHTLYRC
jgi:hypothetical protein